MAVAGVERNGVMQIAWLVPDLAAAAEAWRATTGFGPFIHAAHIAVDDLLYRGSPSTIDFSVAIAQAGGVQIELVQQHCDRPSAYRDLFGRSPHGLHHVGIYCDNYDAELARYCSQGFEVSVSGRLGSGRFAYLDTAAAIGCMVELIERDPGYDEFFALVAARARSWDGAKSALIDP